MTKKFILLALSLLLCVSTASCSDEDNESSTSSGKSNSSTVISEDVIGYESGYLSVELFNFTAKIDGVDYILPALQTAFTKNGWDISGNENSTVKASFKEDAVMSKGNNVFNIQVINPTKNALPFEECPVGRISYDFSGDAEIYIADSFLLNEATIDSVKEKYGEGATEENLKTRSTLTYGGKSETGNYAEYLFEFDEDGKITNFSMVNFYIE